MLRSNGFVLATFVGFMSVGISRAQSQSPNVSHINAEQTKKAVDVLPPIDEDRLHLPAPEPADPFASTRLGPGEDPQNRLFRPLFSHILEDQKNFFLSSREIVHGGGRVFFPFMAFTAGLIASDSWISKQVPSSPSQLQFSKNISDYSAYSMIGAAGGAYLFGSLTHNDLMRGTGFLAGEAAVDSTITAYMLKEITQRQRPYQGNGHGDFFRGGTSFPSEHSAIAWSIASVVAHEYPGPLTKLLAYGLASTITATRVTARQHFPSDVVIGSALGWYFGREVFRAHHDPELGGSAWGDLVEPHQESVRQPENMGSPMVEPGSWIYPLFDRLAALGYVQSDFLGQRPWTRMECARLLQEAGDRLQDENGDGDINNTQAQQIYNELALEFSDETQRLNGAPNLGLTLDSVYSRFENISGTPLRDGFHFAQTLTNDYGRPYWTGMNVISGLNTYAVAGPFFINVQGEYQHAPAIPALPPSALQAIPAVDEAPALPGSAPVANHLLLVNASVGFTLKNVRVSFGRQSNWMGPGESGPLLFSDNAAPIVMLKIESASPYEIPVLSDLLGPVQTEFFLGQLSGQQWIYNGTALQGPGFAPQPFVHGDKISFHPTPNLEFGMGITAMFAGPGLPFTWKEFLKTYYSHKSSLTLNPGKRFSQADATYRVPGLRNWITLYCDTLVSDEFTPIGSSRPMINPGIYMPQFPKLPRLELRVEGLKAPFLTAGLPVGFSYFDRRYRSGYTNDTYLLGSWIGRDGLGGQAWATYSFTPRTNLQFGYRHETVQSEFLEGGNLNDFSARAQFVFHHTLALSGYIQYERWNFPLLAPGAQRDVTASLSIAIFPHLHLHRPAISQ